MRYDPERVRCTVHDDVVMVTVDNFYVIDLDEDGRLRRICNVPNDIGLDVDRHGRIRLAEEEDEGGAPNIQVGDLVVLREGAFDEKEKRNFPSIGDALPVGAVRGNYLRVGNFSITWWAASRFELVAKKGEGEEC